MTKKPPQRLRIGLAIGSRSARGLARLGVINLQLARLTNLVTLYKALGGGESEGDKLFPIRK